ncbi:MAG: T9SS type A sorting domain-containing protein [Candidatus Latescibacteria bacterium]|nr:T9SS type A sorting domain-containing protein [Candidatus Latescibacterota bacterium]
MLLAVTLLCVVPFSIGYAARVDKSAKPAKPAKRGAIARPVVSQSTTSTQPSNAATGAGVRRRPLQPLPPAEFLVVDHGKYKGQFGPHTTTLISEGTFSVLTAAEMAPFQVVYMEPDWGNFGNLTAAMPALTDYVTNGGVAVINVASNIGNGVDIAPGGVDFISYTGGSGTHESEIILLPDHSYITGSPYGGAPLSTPDFDNWNSTDHGHLSEVPPGAEVVLQNTNGPAWIHYTVGAGHVIVTSMTYGWIDGTGAFGAALYNLIEYALFLNPVALAITTPSFVNTTPITITGIAPEPEIVEVTVQVRDMSPVSALFDLDTREFSLDGVALNDGPNSIIARGFDASANQVAMAEKVITLDTINPMIDITSPADGSTIITVEPGGVEVTGTVADEHLAVVRVNGVPATVTDGTFSATLNGISGVSIPLTAVATDQAGNTAQDEVIVTIIAYSPNLYDAANFLYDINAGPGDDGSIDDGGNTDIGSSDAYDGWGYFQVNGDTYYIPGDGGGGEAPVPHPKRLVPLNGLPPGQVTFEDDGREIVMPPVEMYGLHVSRKVFVPAAGPGFARYINQVYNPTGDPITVDLAFTGDLGSDSDTQLTGTSSGQTDDVVAGRDTWFTTDDSYLEEDDPALAHVFDGAGGPDQADEVFYEDGNDEPVIYWREVTVQPGQTLIYLFYEAQRNTTDEALDAAAYLAGIPEALFEGMSQEELDAVQNFPTGIPATLRFADAFARPGGPAVIAVRLESTVPVAGVEFKIQLLCDGNPTGLAVFNGAINHFESQGFTLSSATNPDGVTTVLLFSTSGETIPAGEHTIMQLVYDIDPNTPNGKVFTLMITENILSDPLSHEIAHNLELGSIYVGLPGDVAGGTFGDGDGHLNILDIIKGVKLILGILPAPGPFSFAFFVADANADGVINILDIVWMINEILYGGQPARVIADGPVSPVTVSLGEVQALASGQLAVPVTLQADGTIAGVQAAVLFNPAQIALGTPYLVGRAEGMTVQSQVTGGTLRVVIYSPTGQAIPAGNGPALLVPVTLSGESEATPTLTLGSVILANRQAQAIPMTVGTGTVKVQPLPTAFALKPNRPNPFNPTTRIAYDVPQPAYIVLAVYNLLGQEVIRLVDGPQTPGRYEVVWDGQNAQGLSVASGVYLYRLTTSAGFSQTKRMTLVK